MMMVVLHRMLDPRRRNRLKAMRRFLNEILMEETLMNLVLEQLHVQLHEEDRLPCPPPTPSS